MEYFSNGYGRPWYFHSRMPNLAGEKFERPDDDARGEGDDNRRLVRVSPINKIENFQRGVESVYIIRKRGSGGQDFNLFYRIGCLLSRDREKFRRLTRKNQTCVLVQGVNITVSR